MKKTDILTQIKFRRHYYEMPVIDKLSDYDKGIHKGRAEGLIIAERIIGKWVYDYRLEQLEKKKDENSTNTKGDVNRKDNS